MLKEHGMNLQQEIKTYKQSEEEEENLPPSRRFRR